jgi:hypothetical protein
MNVGILAVQQHGARQGTALFTNSACDKRAAKMVSLRKGLNLLKLVGVLHGRRKLYQRGKGPPHCCSEYKTFRIPSTRQVIERHAVQSIIQKQVKSRIISVSCVEEWSNPKHRSKAQKINTEKFDKAVRCKASSSLFSSLLQSLYQNVKNQEKKAD